MKKIVKVICICACASVLMYGTNFINAYENNNIGFSFDVGGWQTNGRVQKGRYRSTTDSNNSWKAQLKTSTEGKGTITVFWLEHKDGTNVSYDMRLYQGDSARYDSVKKKANQSTVYLTGENNNYSDNYYHVSGYWDEETGVYLNR